MSDDPRKAHGGPTPANRLPSFRAARDLSLGSGDSGRRLTAPEKQRKVFTPNVNVQRKKNRDTTASKGPQSEKEQRHGKGSRQRHRYTPSLVQASASVFAEGAAVTKQSHGSSSSKGAANYLERPTLKLKDAKVNKEEEEALIRRLLSDDFVSFPDQIADAEFAPICLPLSRYAKRKAEKEKEKNNAVVHRAEREKKKNDSIIPGTQKKKEENAIAADGAKKEKGTWNQISLNKIFDSSERQQILIQVPDRLPCLPASRGEEMLTSRSKSSQSGTNQEQKASKEELRYCALEDLAPGLIGELHVRRSGKVEMILGKCRLTVKPGTFVYFRQDLVATQLNPGTFDGNAFNLGPVTGRLICTPDWDSLLKKKVVALD